jgi:hypothetical protein
MGPLLSIVEKGGKVPPGPADPAYFREVVLEAATDPVAHAERVIDPQKAGNQFEELVRAQAAVAKDGVSPSQPFWRAVDYRLGAADAAASEGLLSFGLGDDEKDEFALRAQEARIAFVTQNRREPNDAEVAEILDGVTFRFLGERGDSAMSGRGQFTPGPDPLAGIPAATVSQLKRSLNARGVPATPANVRRHYDLLVAAGAIAP